MTQHLDDPVAHFSSIMDKVRTLENRGDQKAALDKLQEALTRAEADHVSTTVEQHLHVSVLLWRLGRREEAMSRFADLLSEGYPDQLDNASIQWLDRERMLETMRDLFEADGAPRRAALADALAFLAGDYGRFLDKHRKDYDQRMHRLSEDAVKARAKQIVHRLDDPPPISDVTQTLTETIAAFTMHNGGSVLQSANISLAALLQTPPLLLFSSST